MIGLDEITLRGKAWPIHFGQATFADFCDVREISEAEMWSRLGDPAHARPGDWIVLIWSAMFHGARRHSGNPAGDPNFKLTQYDVADMISDTPNAFEQVSKLLQKSLPKQEETGNAEAQD